MTNNGCFSTKEQSHILIVSSLTLIFRVLEIRIMPLPSYFSLNNGRSTVWYSDLCVFYMILYSMTIVRAGLNGSCTRRGRCRFPCERMSGDLSEYTKPFTPMACGRDPSHGLSEPAPLHLSTHPLWNQSPWPTIAMQNTPPALNTISIILNHLPLLSPLSSLAPLPRPLLSLIVNK